MRRALIALVGCAATGLAVSAPAHAEIDTDFANELHTYGIYGPRDYNAWIGKLTCKRLRNGVDHNAHDSVNFVGKQLDRESTTAQAWQFFGTSINYYCPDQRAVYEQVENHA